MANTNKLGVPLLAADQSQKHVTHNEALQRFDQLVQQTVINRTTSVPPGSPSEGHAYIVAAGATGAWVGQENNIAAWVLGAWIFFAPRPGWIVYDEALTIHLKWDGAAWGPAFSVSGQAFGWENFEDTATTGTPITMPAANTWYDLTNNGLGLLTTTVPQISGVGPLWDTSGQVFDFTSLDVYDSLSFRFDITVTTPGANNVVKCRLAFGPSFGFANNFQETGYKSAGPHQIFREFSFAMFNTATRDNSAKFQVSCDQAGATAVVAGWKTEVKKI